VRERSKTVHLQLEHKIVVVKSFRQPLQVCRRKLCEGQSDFSLTEGKN
jgi:hypothetical protein